MFRSLLDLANRIVFHCTHRVAMFGARRLHPSTSNCYAMDGLFSGPQLGSCRTGDQGVKNKQNPFGNQRLIYWPLGLRFLSSVVSYPVLSSYKKQVIRLGSMAKEPPSCAACKRQASDSIKLRDCARCKNETYCGTNSLSSRVCRPNHVSQGAECQTTTGRPTNPTANALNTLSDSNSAPPPSPTPP